LIKQGEDKMGSTEQIADELEVLDIQGKTELSPKMKKFRNVLMVLAIPALLVIAYLMTEPRFVYVAGFWIIFLLLRRSEKFRTKWQEYEIDWKAGLTVGFSWFILFAWLLNAPDAAYNPPVYTDLGSSWLSFMNYLNLDFKVRVAQSFFCAIGGLLAGIFNGSWLFCFIPRVSKANGFVGFLAWCLAAVIFFVALGITRIPHMAS